MDVKQIISVTLILFSIIDILGNLPVVISLKEQGKIIQAGKATIVAGLLMVAFLLAGESILHLFGVDVSSFAIAGGLVIFILGLEMILGVNFFREDEASAKTSSIVPLAFPMIAGAGTLTTILSLKSQYDSINIGIGIAINLAIIYIVLKSSDIIQRKIGKGGAAVLRKVFGIILLAISIKLIKSNLGLEM